MQNMTPSRRRRESISNEPFEFVFYFKRRTRLRGVFIVAVQRQRAELVAQMLHQINECRFLRGVHCVFGLSRRIRSADLHHTNCCDVVSRNVCARFFHRTSSVNRTIDVNDEMIPDVAPTAIQMPFANRVNVNVTTFGCRGTMQNDAVEFTHDLARGMVSFCFRASRIWRACDACVILKRTTLRSPS